MRGVGPRGRNTVVDPLLETKVKRFQASKYAHKRRFDSFLPIDPIDMLFVLHDGAEMEGCQDSLLG